MCDYSLADKLSRPAKVGERLITTSFADTVTRGFAAPNNSATAVCVLPGTEVSFAGSVRSETRTPFEADVNGEKRIIGVPPASLDQIATFIQVDKHLENRHHDALEFSDGNIVLLTNLETGQEVTVLTLPADPKTLQGKERQKAEADQQRAAYV